VSSADTTSALRPGTLLGAYPERCDERPALLARLLRGAIGALRVPRRVSAAEVAAFGRSVDRAARGLDGMDEAAFERAVRELRLSLRRRGLAEELVPPGFALVREAARRALGTPHYDVQLFGGRVLSEGGLAELATGEGKTLTATLPAALAGLAGIPVHVITANDYLVERDARAMRPLYTLLGLTTGEVVEREPDPDARRAAYACDVTYVTNKQVAFDYLRDRLAGAPERGLARSLGIGAARPAPFLRGLCFAIVDEADSVMIDDARTPLILSRPGDPPDETAVHGAMRMARALEVGSHYRIDRHRGEVELTPEGEERLDALAANLSGLLAGSERRREWVLRALYADLLLEPDRHYLVRDGGIQIIDLPTGRRAPERAFEGGIHTLIEAKWGLPLTPRRETLARISYQRFLGRYLRLAGMTGTAREVAREIWNVYRLRTATVPTRRPCLRRDLGLRLFASANEKWAAVVERVAALHREGRPVLVGAATVEASEHLSALLRAAGLSHQVLSAHQDEREAEVVTRAGALGRITVATRMAGRGTDIAIPPEVADLGGLAVIATELGEARRIDRQLFGRCARQGDPGSCEQLVALDEGLLASRPVAPLSRLLGPGPRDGFSAFLLTAIPRWTDETREVARRRRLLAAEQALGDLLAFSG